jgi:hypothetical protein
MRMVEWEEAERNEKRKEEDNMFEMLMIMTILKLKFHCFVKSYEEVVGLLMCLDAAYSDSKVIISQCTAFDVAFRSSCNWSVYLFLGPRSNSFQIWFVKMTPVFLRLCFL